jgi:hypothetical protein
MINKDNSKKYFKYAIGEIILVVIGILIALQINNWNVNRLEKIQENKILANLHIEFDENLKNLLIIDSILNNTSASINIIFDQFGKDPLDFNEHEIDSILSICLNSPTWSPSEFVLNDLKNSGGLSKLHNEELKKLLFDWSRFFSQLSETQFQIENTNLDLIKFIKENGSLRNIDSFSKQFKYKRSLLFNQNKKLLSDYRFENYIDDKFYVLNAAKSEYKNAEELIIRILKETENN